MNIAQENNLKLSQQRIFIVYCYNNKYFGYIWVNWLLCFSYFLCKIFSLK